MAYAIWNTSHHTEIHWNALQHVAGHTRVRKGGEQGEEGPWIGRKESHVILLGSVTSPFILQMLRSQGPSNDRSKPHERCTEAWRCVLRSATSDWMRGSTLDVSWYTSFLSDAISPSSLPSRDLSLSMRLWSRPRPRLCALWWSWDTKYVAHKNQVSNKKYYREQRSS